MGATGREKPVQELPWPNAEHPVLLFTITKIQHLGNYAGENMYALDTTVHNVSSKRISHASFTLQLFDKKQVRVSDGYLSVANVAPGEIVKVRVTANALGVPSTVSLTATMLPPELQPLAPPKQVTITVYSVPDNATVTVDGVDAGTTPVAVKVAVGKHALQFAKQGYKTGSFPLVIAPDQLSGGSVTFELGGASFDTVQMRDGSVVSGDVESMDANTIVVKVGGNLQSLDRNLVKQIMLVQREPLPGPTATNAPAAPH